MHPLLDPPDASHPSFDLVVPSLPGFCWSQGPPRGWTLQDTARIYDALMHRLGYTTYVAQAGDWGHWVVRELGTGRYSGCRAVHTNMCPGAPPKDVSLNAKEQAAMSRAEWWIGEKLHEGHMGYAIEMRTRPQTIGVAFNDHPVGIMMFVGEKYLELADPSLGTATLENARFNHDVCATLSLYFFTPPSVMTSMLCYHNNVRHEEYTEFNARAENLIRVPLGVSTFPYDAFPVPRAGAETTTTNLRFFKGEVMIMGMGLMMYRKMLTCGRVRLWGALCVHGVSGGDGERYAGVLSTVLQGGVTGWSYLHGGVGIPETAYVVGLGGPGNMILTYG